MDIRVVRSSTPMVRACLRTTVDGFELRGLGTAGNDITVYGDGSQTRSFCYVDDLIEGLMAMMGQDEAIGPVNLNPEFTILQLAQLVIELTGTSRRSFTGLLRRSHPAPPRHSPRSRALGVDTDCAVADGLKRTIDYFDASL